MGQASQNVSRRGGQKASKQTSYPDNSRYYRQCSSHIASHSAILSASHSVQSAIHSTYSASGKERGGRDTSKAPVSGHCGGCCGEHCKDGNRAPARSSKPVSDKPDSKTTPSRIPRLCTTPSFGAACLSNALSFAIQHSMILVNT